LRGYLGDRVKFGGYLGEKYRFDSVGEKLDESAQQKNDLKWIQKRLGDEKIDVTL
jgi:hypothetical protein